MEKKGGGLLSFGSNPGEGSIKLYNEEAKPAVELDAKKGWLSLKVGELNSQ